VALPPLPCLYCPPDGSPCGNCGDDGDSPPASAAEAAPAIDLGNLTGVWADVFARQDDLYAKHERKARAAWRKATAGLDLAALIAVFRRHALMDDGPAAGAGSESPEAAKRHRAEILALARSMAAGFLAGVNDQPDYSELLAAVTSALIASAGEGTASALAVSAAAAGYTAFDWAKAFRDGKTPPDPTTVNGWLAKIIAGAVTDLAKSLTAGAIAGLSADAMLKAASKVMRAAGAVTAFVNQAMSSAVSAAIAAAYAALGGIELLDFLTAGDSLVCATCDECADNGPYSIADYPGCQHPRCRCVPSPAAGMTLPFGAFAAYLVGL
jgi:hypothetical protein